MNERDSFITTKSLSVMQKNICIQGLVEQKQLRIDSTLINPNANNYAITSALTEDPVYAKIGTLMVKQIEAAPAPIKVGDVYKTRDGKSCRIIVADKKGVFPIIGLADDGDIEIPYTYTSKGTISSNSEHPADLMRPKITRRVVEFVADTPHGDPINQWGLGDYPGF